MSGEAGNSPAFQGRVMTEDLPMPLPDSVAELVERSENSRSEYHKGHYNETQTRIDYVILVEQMLKLHKDKVGARLGQEKAMLQREIEATDAQIDRLVYDLYGLTEDEIEIVEAAR